MGSDLGFMRAALFEAEKARALGEVPVGAVVVVEDHIISRGHNLRERTQNPSAHAEHLALCRAAEELGTWRLSGATLYVTLEPCAMCAGLIVNSRPDRVVWGADDPKAGAMESLYRIGRDPRLNHQVEVKKGVLGASCGAMLSSFFRDIRHKRITKPSRH